MYQCFNDRSKGNLEQHSHQDYTDPITGYVVVVEVPSALQAGSLRYSRLATCVTSEAQLYRSS